MEVNLEEGGTGDVVSLEDSEFVCNDLESVLSRLMYYFLKTTRLLKGRFTALA